MTDCAWLLSTNQTVGITDGRRRLTARVRDRITLTAARGDVVAEARLAAAFPLSAARTAAINAAVRGGVIARDPAGLALCAGVGVYADEVAAQLVRATAIVRAGLTGPAATLNALGRGRIVVGTFGIAADASRTCTAPRAAAVFLRADGRATRAREVAVQVAA